MGLLFDDEELEFLSNKKNVTKSVSKKVERHYDVLDPEELVQMNKQFEITVDDKDYYTDFTEEKYPASMNFYDFEVFQYDWMVVIINPIQKIKKIIVNDAKALYRYYKKHVNEIWCGYNSNNYDVFILKGILLGMNPKKINDNIIYDKMKGYEISREFSQIRFYNFDISDKFHSLKQFEAFMGNDIEETSVPFDLDRKLTRKEISETIKYCIHDVEQTIEVFRNRIYEWNAQADLINTFDLPINCVSYTKARMTAKILGCEKIERNDEWNYSFVDTLRLNKYKFVQDWFAKKENHDYKKMLSVDVLGVPHQFGWGGLHGCPIGPLHAKGRIYHVDVTSYYPSIMIEYNFLTRNSSDKGKYKEIYDKRVALKKAGKKKEQAPFKIVLNGAFGMTKDKHSDAFDPRQANNVCVNGQLMLLDLLEHLEGTIKLIQSNTDGLIVQVFTDEEDQKLREICKEWENRTGMGLGVDEISEIWQGDVNNYVFKFTNGKLERKGAYVKELSNLDYDLPIVNEAILKNLTENIPVADTVNNCNEFRKFQKVYKVSGNYAYAWHNGKKLKDKTHRIFASTDNKDSYLGKVKYDSDTVEKFADCPEHCFVYNGDVKDKPISIKIDKQWYINLAERRLKDKFGIISEEERKRIESSKQMDLF